MTFLKTILHIIQILIIKIHFQNKGVLNYLNTFPTIKLPKKTIKRIKLYCILCTYIGHFFALLRNKKLNSLENKLLQNLSILIPLYDDLMDELQFSHSQIRELVLDHNLTKHPYFEIISPLAYEILNSVKDKNEFLNLLENIGKIQDLSLRQTQLEKLSDSELEFITYQKGGLSLEMIRLMCFNETNTIEKDFVFQLGSQFQFINDIFDIYKDRESQTQTLCTNCNDFTILKNRFELLNENIISASLKLPYSKKSIRTALHFFIPVLARGQVAANQLANLKTIGSFSIHNYSRKELICDMEKTKNIYLNIKYYFALIQKLN